MTISKTQLKHITKLLHFIRNIIILITLGYSSAYSAEIVDLVTIDQNTGELKIDRPQVEAIILNINDRLKKIENIIFLANNLQNKSVEEGKNLALTFWHSLDVYDKCKEAKKIFDQRLIKDDFVNSDAQKSLNKVVDDCYQNDYMQIDSIIDQFELFFNNSLGKLKITKDQVKLGEVEAMILVAKRAFYQTLLDSSSTNSESSD